MRSGTEILPRHLFPLPERLVSSHTSLVCLALLVNAVVQPYLGLFHDARLYAFYLQSRLEPGLGFDQDLYLVYGSQDRYSLFSLFMFPVVKLFGLDAGIFIVYLVSKALLLWAFCRLLRALTRNDLVTAVTVILLAASPIPFGGNGVFHVNESFLTPRLAAAAFVLLGLEQMLAGKRWLPGLLILAAMLLHPLMGVAGVLIGALSWAFGRFNWWQLGALLLLACGISAAVLAYEPLGSRLFGNMDDRWQTVILHTCFFIRPPAWAVEDWSRMAFECVLLIAGAVTFGRHCARFLWAVLGAGLIGLAWSFVGVETHYLLLIQTSPYRTLWVLEFLALPLGMMAVADLWGRGTVRSRGASLALLLLLTHELAFKEINAVFVVLVVAALGVWVIWHRGLRREPARADWQWLAVWHTFLTGCGLLVLFTTMVLWYVFHAPPTADVPRDPINLPRMLGPIVSRLLWCVAACYGAAGVGAVLGFGRRFQVAVVGVAVAYLGVGAYLLDVPWYLDRFVPDERHTTFVADYLDRQRDPAGPAPCVYWDTDIGRIWFRLRAKSYVTVYQLAGCAFNRETAFEGKRRVHLVGRFEAEGDRQQPKAVPDRWQQFWEEYRDCPADAPPPTRDDLMRLAGEEMLDYAILPVAIDDLYSVSDGRYFIYDCKRLRALWYKAPASAAVATTTGR